MSIAFILALSGSIAAEPPFDAQTRVSEAIAAVRPVAYNALQVDWSAIELEMREIAAKAKDTADMLPAYAVLVYRLGDNHSFLRPPPAVMEAYRARYGTRRLVPDAPPRRPFDSPFVGRSDPAARMIAAGKGQAVLLTVPSVEWVEGNESAPYGNKLWSLVAASATTACGYIVDLRGNTGGDQFPMINGLGALLGDLMVVGTIDATGKIGPTVRTKGAAVIGETGNKREVMNRITDWKPYAALVHAPVAVLTDGSTASSGEGVTLAFKGRAHTRSFGMPTYGVASSNTVVDLRDGVRLFVTMHMATDRNGAIYPKGIYPDETVEHGPGDSDDPEDAVVERAIRWLAAEPACVRP